MFGKFTGLFTAWRQQRIALRKLRQMTIICSKISERPAMRSRISSRQRRRMPAQSKGPPSTGDPWTRSV